MENDQLAWLIFGLSKNQCLSAFICGESGLSQQPLARIGAAVIVVIFDRQSQKQPGVRQQ
jgi:hypothetical protein